jgi:carbonic anhydrase
MTASAVTIAAGKTNWGYSGPEGPDHWGELAPEFSACSDGKNQSPIDLTGLIEGQLPEIQIDYKTGGNEVLNNGHSIQVNYAPKSTLGIAGHSFELQQFHFHSPSEHTIEGQSYPMEAHFVHADKDGSLAVIAVLFSEGETNAELEKAWSHMPAHAGEKHVLDAPVNADALLPPRHDYYGFTESLTTPPCSEGVRWLVMKDVDTASKEQIGKFTDTMHHANNRPVQPINARLIIQ